MGGLTWPLLRGKIVTSSFKWKLIMHHLFSATTQHVHIVNVICNFIHVDGFGFLLPTCIII